MKIHSIYLDQFWLDGKWWPFAQWDCPTMKRILWSQPDIDLYRPVVLPEKGDVMLDIGAFTGDTLFPFAVLGYEIIAFEPNPSTFRCLQANWSALTAKGVVFEAHNSAIMPTGGGETVFNYTDDLVNGGFDIPNHDKKVSVRAILWDENMLNGKRLKYLKIDAEGLDVQILGAMSQTIANHRPVIRTEIIHYLPDNERTGLIKWMDQIGYVSEGVDAKSSLNSRRETYDLTLVPI